MKNALTESTRGMASLEAPSPTTLTDVVGGKRSAGSAILDAGVSKKSDTTG
jgi:hypothetical protein